MPNYTLLTIPAMWLTALAPHAWATPYVKRHNGGRFDNANFKTSAFAAKLAANVPADVLATYERAEAAHRNGLENLPLFAAGVLAATWADVDIAWGAWTYVALRLLYSVIYINVSTTRKSFLRSAIWGVSTLLCLSFYVRAALA